MRRMGSGRQTPVPLLPADYHDYWVLFEHFDVCSPSGLTAFVFLPVIPDDTACKGITLLPHTRTVHTIFLKAEKT